jgi:hypothetical protein
MKESFVANSVVTSFLNRHARSGHLAKPGALVAAGSVEVLIDGNDEGLADRPGLGAGLAQITSRLLEQLATGDERIPDADFANTPNPQRDTHGSRVPRDRSSPVAWQRVVAVSAAGSMLGLVSLPAQSGTP